MGNLPAIRLALKNRRDPVIPLGEILLGRATIADMLVLNDAGEISACSRMNVPDGFCAVCLLEL